MRARLATKLVRDAAEEIVNDWEQRCGEDPRASSTFLGDLAFVRALGRALAVPQVTKEGPDREWATASGQLANRMQGISVTIGAYSRQLLHLEDVLDARLSSLDDSEDIEELRRRIHRVLYLALEVAAGTVARILDHAAHRDRLTSLLNRRAFDRDAENAVANKADGIVIAMVDIDDLKAVNDEQGHEAGDRLIGHVGAALSRVAEPGVSAYRFGGDEFAVLSLEAGRERIERQLEQLRAEEVRFSFGIATWPDDNPELSEIVRIADERMYADKRQRKAKLQSESLSTRMIRWISKSVGG